MMNEMAAVDQRAVWSLLDQKGTQTMMKSVLGDALAAGRLRHREESHEESARYTMDFANGVRFDMAVVMSRHR